MPFTLADAIEAYLLELVAQARRTVLEVSRRELAERFRCAPSQINYVLETRFTPERGFVVRSRRGGGGCIVIIPVTFDGVKDVLRHLHRLAGQGLSAVQARHIVNLLQQHAAVTEREARLMEAVVSAPLAADRDGSDLMLRGRLVRRMLEVLMA